MEKLEITNFLSIEKAEIEIKKLNIFIGPQAQGKSLISKLIYFFKEYPQTLFEAVHRGMKTEGEYNGLALAKFEKIFPKYTWKNDKFNIRYSNKYYSISIANQSIDPETNPVLELTLTGDAIFQDAFESLKSLKSLKGDLVWFARSEKTLAHSLFSKNKNPYLEKVFYIPAGRSFFANLDKSIFSFLSSEIKIDYFLTLFGKTYEGIRGAITEGYDGFEGYDDSYKEEKKRRLEGIVKHLIGGDYSFEQGQDWITNEKGKIKIADASSGQQEALPMAVVLSIEPYILPYIPIIDHHTTNHFIIEEPEAHLFPVAQNEIVLLVANAYNHKKNHNHSDYVAFNGFNSFTIATHSPYILTAFNNLIQAGNVAASKSHEDLEELYKIVPESELVDFNDVTAYIVDKGTVRSILNRDLKLIDASMIDEISGHFADTFEKLLVMEEMDG